MGRAQPGGRQALGTGLVACALLLAAPTSPAAAAPASWRPTWWPSWLPAGNGQPNVVIRLRRNRLYAHDGYRRWRQFVVASGKDYNTPRGSYRIVSKTLWPAWNYKDEHVPGGAWGNPLGVAWLGLGMPAWWGGSPIGIHGTNAPGSIGLRVSHGCIRMYNGDVLALYRMVPVGCWVHVIM